MGCEAEEVEVAGAKARKVGTAPPGDVAQVLATFLLAGRLRFCREAIEDDGAPILEVGDALAVAACIQDRV